MAEALYSIDDYTEALLTILPRGRVWPKDPGTVQHAVAEALAGTYERLDARAQTLLVDAFPTTTLELLPEWEASLGLPDPCEGDGQGLEQRRGQIVSRLTSAGGQSVAYFLGVVAQLGYTGAEITQYAPFRTDRSATDFPLYSEAWAFAWTLNLPDLRVFYFQTDISATDEALVIIANGVATCVINALAPAHTVVIYTNDPGGLDFEDPNNSEWLPVI